MKNFARFAVVLALLCSGAAFAADTPELPVADTASQVAAVEEAPAVEAAPEQAENDPAPLMSTVLDQKKNNVDYADCIVCCRAIYDACTPGPNCWSEWQTCKANCQADPGTCQ